MKTKISDILKPGNKINWRGYIGYVIECLNPKQKNPEKLRYCIDSHGFHWSLSLKDLQEYNKILRFTESK